jgi:photosystem II stability/assembly factor-like uncharacterized protein
VGREGSTRLIFPGCSSALTREVGRSAGTWDCQGSPLLLGHVLVSEKEVRRTTDGGKSWSFLGKLKVPERVRVNALSFPSPGNGWVVGDKGFIAHYQSK